MKKESGLMAGNPKIPLDERLKRLGSKTAIPYALFELYIDDFFAEASRMCEGYKPDLWSLYESEVKQFNYRDNLDCVLAEIVHIADELSRDDQINLLYRVLVEPFAALENREKEKTK